MTTQQSKAAYGGNWKWVVRNLNGSKEESKEAEKVGSQGQIISKDTSLQVFLYMFQELRSGCI